MRLNHTAPGVADPTGRAGRTRGATLSGAAAALLLAFLPVVGGAGAPASARPMSAHPVSSVALGVVVTAVQTDSGAVGDAQVSSDGVQFASSLPSGLFDSYGVLIPNGSMRASLWIRNPSDQPAVVRVSLRSGAGASAGLNDYLTLRVSTPADPSVPAVSVAGDAECAVLAPVQSLAAGATLRADLTIDMMDVTGLTAQNESADLGIVIALRDAVAGLFSHSACDDDGVLVTVLGVSPAAPAALPGTGTDLPVPALLGGGLLLGLGAVLVRRRRPDRPEP